ncbi:MAG TPA: protein-L-isoaspartate(D-aspartate) O-methyltransferase [Candidatus Limnocylindrales bacterium]|jgi:protein-L-isoaspartate(D-aspartate) O-methyltransferase
MAPRQDQPDGSSTASARGQMVERQLRTRGVSDERVLAAMLAVPREAFLDEGQRPLAYADEALPIASGQTISQPYIVARMTELLAVGPGDRVLEIGTGSGYQAAVLAAIGCRVTTIERHAGLAEEARERLGDLGFGDLVDVRIGDGSVGAPDGAPWRGILVAAAAPTVPDALREQLDPVGGRLVVPVGPRDHQELIVVTRHGDEWTERSDGPVAFVPLIGEGGFSG